MTCLWLNYDLFIICSLDLFMTCSLDLFTTCSLLVYYLFMICCQAQPQPQLQLSWAEIALLSQLWGTTHPPAHPTPGIVVFKLQQKQIVSREFKICSSQLVHELFKLVENFFMTCSQRFQNILTTCSFENYFFMTCSQSVYDLFTTCTKLPYDLFTICSWIFHVLFTTFHIFS